MRWCDWGGRMMRHVSPTPSLPCHKEPYAQCGCCMVGVPLWWCKKEGKVLSRHIKTTPEHPETQCLCILKRDELACFTLKVDQDKRWWSCVFNLDTRWASTLWVAWIEASGNGQSGIEYSSVARRRCLCCCLGEEATWGVRWNGMDWVPYSVLLLGIVHPVKVYRLLLKQSDDYWLCKCLVRSSLTWQTLSCTPG